MPVEKVESGNDRCWGLWHILETSGQLSEKLTDVDQIPVSITHERKRLEWMAGRLLTRHLLERMGATYHGIVKDQYGKPSPIGNSYRLSLSHSFPYVAALIDKNDEVGIDLEQPKEKLLRIAHRVLSPTELLDAGDDTRKHCIYWCAKEALIKVYGKKDLVLAENLQIEPFSMKSDGYIFGRIIVGEESSPITLYYRVFEQFIVALSAGNDKTENQT